MGTTDIYKLRTPELGDLADGPDAFNKLADDVETNMTISRNWFRSEGVGTAANSSGVVIAPNETRRVLDPQNPGLIALGWCEIDLSVTLGPTTGSPSDPGTWAGSLYLYFNGVLAGIKRFHNHSLAPLMEVECTSTVQLVASGTLVSITADISLDAPANRSLRSYEWQLNVRQYGAPRKTL